MHNFELTHSMHRQNFKIKLGFYSIIIIYIYSVFFAFNNKIINKFRKIETKRERILIFVEK
jgi:hypothetical protein